MSRVAGDMDGKNQCGEVMCGTVDGGKVVHFRLQALENILHNTTLVLPSEVLHFQQGGGARTSLRSVIDEGTVRSSSGDS